MNIPRPDPRFCLPVLVVSAIMAGALSGSAIGSTPILDRGVATQIPEAARNAGVGDFKLDSSDRLPNHYPLVTPNGTIPVAALAEHGRLRNARGGWRDNADLVALDADYGDLLSQSEIDRLEHWRPVPRRVSPSRTSTTADAVRVARGAEKGVLVSTTKPVPRARPGNASIPGKAQSPSQRDGSLSASAHASAPSSNAPPSPSALTASTR